MWVRRVFSLGVSSAQVRVSKSLRLLAQMRRNHTTATLSPRPAAPGRPEVPHPPITSSHIRARRRRTARPAAPGRPEQPARTATQTAPHGAGPVPRPHRRVLVRCRLVGTNVLQSPSQKVDGSAVDRSLYYETARRGRAGVGHRPFPLRVERRDSRYHTGEGAGPGAVLGLAPTSH